jgi:hypothetical protein
MFLVRRSRAKLFKAKSRTPAASSHRDQARAHKIAQLIDAERNKFGSFAHIFKPGVVGSHYITRWGLGRLSVSPETWTSSSKI